MFPLPGRKPWDTTHILSSVKVNGTGIGNRPGYDNHIRTPKPEPGIAGNYSETESGNGAGIPLLECVGSSSDPTGSCRTSLTWVPFTNHTHKTKADTNCFVYTSIESAIRLDFCSNALEKLI